MGGILNMESIGEWLREVGELSSDGTLTRGVLTVGAAALAVALTAWRAFRGKPAETPRVKIDAPSDVEISVKPRGEAKVTVVGLKHAGDPIAGTTPRPPEHLSFTTEQEAWLEKTLASLRSVGEPAADARAREERASREARRI
jgi:hypothetical protein